MAKPNQNNLRGRILADRSEKSRCAISNQARCAEGICRIRLGIGVSANSTRLAFLRIPFRAGFRLCQRNLLDTCER
jgi:hypothetical protein